MGCSAPGPRRGRRPQTPFIQAFVLALLLAPGVRAQDAASGVVLEVVVTNVKTAEGRVRVAVCTRADFLQPHCAHFASAPAQVGSTTVAVPGIPPGTYAVQAYHDANDNGRIDRNFLGLPTEAIGFSRDAPMRFGPPRFDDAAIQLGPQGGRITLALRSF